MVDHHLITNKRNLNERLKDNSDRAADKGDKQQTMIGFHANKD